MTNAVKNKTLSKERNKSFIYIQCSLKTAEGKRLQVFLSLRKKNACIIFALANIHSTQKVSLNKSHSFPEKEHG